jgi:exodeoxyribonuclease V gamma subunit
MTTIHRSDHTEHLVERLADYLSRPAAPLSTDIVLVHSNGLGTWLEQRIAHHLGLCAGVEFLQPIELMTRLETAEDGWSRQRLVWTLLDLLQTHLHALPEVEEWSLADGPGYQDRRLAQLAVDLAPRFERYALYRPQETRTWGSSGTWQHVLWHHLTLRLTPPFSSPDWASRIDTSRGLPGRLAVFCTGILAPTILELLASVGSVTPLEMFVLRPRVLSGHPLLTSLGGQASAFDRLLRQYFPAADVRDAFPESAASGVLGSVQRVLAAPERVAIDLEPTIRVHRCGGAQRQVEVLRDVLFEAFEDNSLQPRDVLVMTTDVDRFGPMIRAAMRMNRGEASPAIPMRLADTSLRVRNTAARALWDAIEIVQGRFEVTSVLDLLGRPEVALHWGVEPDTMTTIRKLTARAAIHWGTDVAQKVEFRLPATESFTWRHGLDRLLIGLATSSQEMMLDLAPVGDPKAQSHAVGILTGFVDGLIAAREALTGEQPALSWQVQLLALLDHLCGKGKWTVRAVRTALDDVASADESGRPLQLGAFLQLLQDRFDLSEPGQHYLAGGVTVCAMVPMRSIPFRVVCLLGMDEDAYPRAGAQPAYDIMAADLRDGDVNARQDDRALLLETLLSTRDRLEIFTTSRSPRDGQERPPAVPVAELLDVLEEARPGLAAAVTVDHPLQPYAAAPFLERRSFDPEFCKAARAAVVGRTAQAQPHLFLDHPLELPETFKELPLHRLEMCLRNPMQFFCTQSLGLYLRDDDDALEDTEPLDDEKWDGHLGLWKLKQKVTQVLIAGGDPLEVLSARGELPAGTRGAMIVDGVLEPCQALADSVRVWPAPVPRRVDIEVDGIRLHGAVALRDGCVLAWTPSQARQKHKLAVWVRAVALRACDVPVEGVVLCHKTGTARHEAPTMEHARELLGAWMAIVKDSLRAPLPFVAGFANAYNRDDWNPDVYTSWVLAGQRMDQPDLVGLPAMPGRSFAELETLILGAVP